MNKQSSNQTLVQRCYKLLEEEIINNKLTPGQKLPIEMLKQKFETGNSPLREALSQLSSAGLIEIKPNRGFYVATVSEPDIRDIYKTFTQIELLALQQAIELGDDNWKANIVAKLYQLKLLEANKDTSVEYQLWSERNIAFHDALIAGCNSPTLLQIRKDLYRKFDRYCRLSFSLVSIPRDFNYDEHRALADAVLKRDQKTACDLMTKHICGSLEDVIAALKTNNII